MSVGAPKTHAPSEALAYWRGKAQVGDAEFASLSQATRNRAFAVNGLAAGDLLNDVYLSLDRALERGESLATWKKGLAAELEKLGWTGPGAYKANLVYRTNMQAAYQAGRWAQFERTKDALPILVYSAVNDSRTRPTHRAMHGMAFPMDHPFWKRFYPPNGYNCRCTARPMSREQANALGVKVLDEIPEVVETPNGLVRIAPDHGWSGNVGKDGLEGLSPRPAEGPLKDLVSSAWCPEGKGAFASDPCRPPLAGLDWRHVLPVRKGEILKEGLAPEAYALAFLREFGIQDIEGSTVVGIPGTPLPLVVSKELLLDKASGELKSAESGRGPYLPLMAWTILNPYEVWCVPTSLSGKERVSLRLVRLFRDAGGNEIGGFGVFNLIGGRYWRGSTIFPPKIGSKRNVMLNYLEKQRVGTLLYREEAS